MTFKKNFTAIMAGTILSVGAVTAGAIPAQAAETPNQTQAQSQSGATSDAGIETKKINESQSEISSENFNFFEDEGYVKAKNIASGEVEDLPGTAENADGDTVDLRYNIKDDHTVDVSLVSTDNAGSGPAASTQSAGDDAKCWGGVVSSGLLGAGAGAAGGVVGSVVLGTAGSVKGALDYC